MRKVNVVLDPKLEGTAPIVRDVFARVLRQSLTEVGCDFAIHTDAEKVPYNLDHVFIFLMSPKRVLQSLPETHRRNGVYVFWNFESITPVGNGRARSFYDLVHGFIENRSFDLFWHFAEDQLANFGVDRALFVPLGFSPDMCFLSDRKARDVIFLGETCRFREELFRYLREGSISFFEHGVSEYSGVESMLQLASSFSVGLDCTASPEDPDYIRWHRLASYVPNFLVLVTDNDLLENYGFVEGVHYFLFKKGDALDLVKVIYSVLRKPEIMRTVAQAMFDKFRSEFGMSDILRSKLANVQE